MAQHDGDIANQLFPNVRADLNAALVALMTSNSGATAPTTTFASMWWYDTSTDILKIRNKTNTAWINVFNALTASTYAPGPTGPTGPQGIQGPVGPSPDTSNFMLKTAPNASAQITGPSLSVSGAGWFGSLSVGSLIVSNNATIQLYNGMVQAQQFRFFGAGSGGDWGFDWWGGVGIGLVTGGGFKGYFDGSGNAVFPNFIIYSDRKLKKEIKPLGSVGALVDKISPKKYKMKADDAKEHYGFIAQDFDGLPVQMEVDRKLKGLEQMGVLAILWKALQETRAELKELKDGRV
jgi:hypothetical protein